MSQKDNIATILLGLYSITLLTAPVYSVFFEKSILSEQRYFLAVLLTASIGTAIAVALFRSQLYRYAHGDDEDSVWNEIILYAATFIPVVIGTALVIVLINNTVSGETEAPVLVHLVLATVVTVALLVGRRRGTVTYPDWIQTSSWGLTDYIALFGSVFLLTYTYLSPAFGPTGGPLTLVAILCATAAVLLRRAGAFVPRSRGTAV